VLFIWITLYLRHFESSVENTAKYSRTVLAWTGNASGARFIYFRLFVQELQAKTFRAFYVNSDTRREDGRVKGNERTKECVIAPQSDNSSCDSNQSGNLHFIRTQYDNSSSYSDQSSALNFIVTQSENSSSDSDHSGA